MVLLVAADEAKLAECISVLDELANERIVYGGDVIRDDGRICWLVE